MFWRMTALSATSPVESILDKENFTLEELLDEEEIIQECKALNSRLINFLRDRAQVEQLLRYIVEEALEDAESKRIFKFPFIACEIFTCEIDVILKTLVEEEELMNLLFSFLEPNRAHCTLLAGYFSKVVICLMLRKTVPLMNYVQAHQDVFQQLVDLIGITSIMEVLIRLVGADDHMYPNFMDVMQWLADSNLLEMIVDKLNPFCPPEVHVNAAETLCSITRNAPSPLSNKLCSTSFVTRIFTHALEDSESKSALVHSLTVCISLLDPKRLTSPLLHSMRSQHFYEPPIPVNPETVGAMLPKLSDLLNLLNVCSDERALPTTYGELKPPLGKHRLKIVEFIAVLLRTGHKVADKDLVSSGAIQRIIDLFFEYPFNSALHHHVESIIVSCLESKNDFIVDHLFQECNLISKFLQADRHPVLSSDSNQPTSSTTGRKPPRAGNLGHITRISNKLLQLGNGNERIQARLQFASKIYVSVRLNHVKDAKNFHQTLLQLVEENAEWPDWQSTVLQERNVVENVNRWACGRPTALHDRTRDSDDDELQDRDYDVATLANNLSQAFRYSLYENDDAEQVHGSLERDDEDVYFDDESAEVVISSLRLGDDQDSSLFSNSNWFAFQDDRIHNGPLSTSPSEKLDDIKLNGTTNGGSSSSDDEVMVGEDEELVDTSSSMNGVSGLSPSVSDGMNINDPITGGDDNNNDITGDRPLPEWVGWRESSDLQVGRSDANPFNDIDKPDVDMSNSMETSESAKVKLPNGTTPMESSKEEAEASHRATMPSLFEEDVEFVGVELEGTERAMEQALKEGIVGEAGPLKRNLTPKSPEKEQSDRDGAEMLEFNDANYWRVEQEVGVVQE